MTALKYALSISLTVFAASCAEGPDQDLPGSDKADEISDQCIEIERREPLTEGEVLDDPRIATVMQSKVGQFWKQDVESALQEVTNGNVIPSTKDSPEYDPGCWHSDYDNGYTVADCRSSFAILTNDWMIVGDRNDIFDYFTYLHPDEYYESNNGESRSFTEIILDADDESIRDVYEKLAPEVKTGGCFVSDENPNDPKALYVRRTFTKKAFDEYTEKLEIEGSGHWQCDAADATFKCSAVR